MNTAAHYSEQLDRAYAALKASRYPAALINRKHALLQHDNDSSAHTAALIKAKIKELPPPPELNFFLIQDIALNRCHRVLLPPNRLNDIVVKLNNW